CIYLSSRTLYCAKGNYDFGITRVIKSLEPYNKKLGTDTWFYAKRCFLSLLENTAKHMIMIRDSVVQECIQFLEHCEVYGKTEPAMIEQPLRRTDAHRKEHCHLRVSPLKALSMRSSDGTSDVIPERNRACDVIGQNPLMSPDRTSFH
uniref:tetratricopeptide repeat protein 30A-like n=1 Tax=Oncorhynchus gorbuscha TaxID=8017 RepID=UPI001EAEBD10